MPNTRNMQPVIRTTQGGSLWTLVRSGVALLGMLSLFLSTAPAEVVTEHYLKGVFLYNFARLTEWPATEHGDTFDICVVGRTDVVDEIRTALAGKTIANVPIVTRRLKDAKSGRSCRVLFLDGDVVGLDKDLDVGKGVLTVGEADDFLHRGGMIRFVNVDGHLSFDVSTSTAQQRGVKLSSRLLSVARRVE